MSGAGLALAGVAGALATHEALLLAGCATIGFAAALLTSALAALTGALVDEAPRARLLGIQVATSDIFSVAGGAASGMLAAQLGWHGPFAIFIAFGTFLIVTLATARIKRPPVPRGQGGLLKAARLAWTTYVAGAFIFFLVSTFATQLPFYLEQLGYDTAPRRAVLTTFALVATMCGSIGFATMQGRIAPWRVQALGVASAVAGFCGLAIWDGGLGGGFIYIFLANVGVGLTVPVLFAATLRKAPDGLRGHAIGLLNVANFLGSFLSPLFLSPVAAALGYHALYAGMAVAVAIVGAARVAYLVRRQHGPAEPLPMGV